MANSYFRFKQFTVHQEHCAMKVCTDACIFGAFVADHILGRQLKADHILDIGSGTGLLSLMIAQKIPGIIDAVEIDKPAFQQANNNFTLSPWNQRLTIVNADAHQYASGKRYDFIISNPPFFEGDLTSGNIEKDSAKHDATLTLEQLLPIIGRNLSDHGNFAILLPYHRVGFFVEMANVANFFLYEQLLIQHTITHPFFRGILFFSHNQTTVTRKELAIKKQVGNYTQEFITLLEEYYLHL